MAIRDEQTRRMQQATHHTSNASVASFETAHSHELSQTSELQDLWEQPLLWEPEYVDAEEIVFDYSDEEQGSPSLPSLLVPSPTVQQREQEVVLVVPMAVAEVVAGEQDALDVLLAALVVEEEPAEGDEVIVG